MPGARGEEFIMDSIKLLPDGSVQLGFRNGASIILEEVDGDVWLTNIQPNGDENNHWLSPIETLDCFREVLKEIEV